MNDIKGRPKRKSILIRKDQREYKLGEMDIPYKFDQSKPKTIFAAAYAIGRDTSGTLVYADGRSQAEKIAILLADAIGETSEVETELSEFSESIKQMIHPRYALKDVVLRGVGFHYGNMPALLRDELERLFKEQKLKYLVCTSTLVEGVNLAAKSIVTRAPKKGRGRPMEGQDFWNLAGRAGRWGKDFYGNVICVQADNETVWSGKVPVRKKYRIKKASSEIYSSDSEGFVEYLNRRITHRTIYTADSHYEYLFAYWIGKVLNGEQEDINVDETNTSRQAKSLIAHAVQDILNIDVELAAKHPGVSAWSLQNLYNHFESNSDDIVSFIPTNLLEWEESVARYIDLFSIVNEHLFPAFEAPLLFPYALTTARWMHGLSLSVIIRKNEDYFRENRIERPVARVIRDTMTMVEEISRFKAPKYLSAYLDVLQKYLLDTGRENLYPDELKLDLYLEFGVATKTLLSLIGIGLSRTSALALNEHFSDDYLSEPEVFERLIKRQWMGWQLLPLVMREIGDLINDRSHILSGKSDVP